MKIVINKCWGGFGISLEAARFMAERGSKQAAAEVADWERENRWLQEFLTTGRWNKEIPEFSQSMLEISAKYRSAPTFHGYGYVDGFDEGYSRTDPLLIEAVETLGEKANGEHASLHVVEIPDGIKYYIHNYDGQESVEEEHRSWG